MEKKIDSMATIIAGVKAHALANYDAGGWDVIIECYEDHELEETITELAAAYEKTIYGVEDAIKILGDTVVSVWAERQADARYYEQNW